MGVGPAEGGRIVSLLVGGVDRILPRESARPSALATGWGCYPMVPWAASLAEGRIPTEEGGFRLEQNRPPTTIHGPVFYKPWGILARWDSTVSLRRERRTLGWPLGG